MFVDMMPDRRQQLLNLDTYSLRLTSVVSLQSSPGSLQLGRQHPAPLLERLHDQAGGLLGVARTRQSTNRRIAPPSRRVRQLLHLALRRRMGQPRRTKPVATGRQLRVRPLHPLHQLPPLTHRSRPTSLYPLQQIPRTLLTPFRKNSLRSRPRHQRLKLRDHVHCFHSSYRMS
jgi:hypothetical protein